MPRPARIAIAFFAPLFVLTLSATTNAQDRWTIHFHGGASVVPDPGSGRTALPAPAPTVSTIPGVPTRAVPSWFFGDGLTLMNQVNAQLQPSLVASGLDPLLARSALSGGVAPAFGVRVTRSLTTRLSIEGAVSLQTGGITMSDEVRAITDGALTSFRAFWQTARQPTIVEAQAQYDDESGRQLTSTAALRLHLVGSQGRSLFAIAGGGVRSTFGHESTMTLEGVYSIRSGLLEFTEVDNVTLSFDVDRHVPVGLLGIGWEQPVSARAGFSLEVRAHIGRSGVSTRVSTAPERNELPSGVTVVVLGRDPTIYVSNTRFADSSLTTNLTNFRTYEDRGVQAQTAITGGLFFRF